MKGTFKESEIEIEVIDLSEGRKDKPMSFVDACTRISDMVHKSFFGEDDFEDGVVIQVVDEIHKKEDEQTAKDLVKQNKAMKTSIALLEKCLDEAARDRDKAMQRLNNALVERDCYKRQLDKLNIMFDKYIRREKQIRNTDTEKICGKCRFYNHMGCECRCAMSDNFREITDSGYGCDRYEPNA